MPRHGTHSWPPVSSILIALQQSDPPRLWANTLTRAFLLVSALPRLLRFERAQEDFLRSAFQLGARYGGARVHLETDRNAAFARLRETAGARSCARPPLALAPRGFDPSAMSAAEGVPAPARSPTASAESDSEDSSDSEVELTDPKESLRWLGYACRVCADAVPRRAPFRRRRVVARPRRAVPTACEKHATRVRARRSCSNPEPPLTPASRAPLHRAHRLVALASGRRPVSDGGFTGVRLPRTRARRARPPAPRPVETSSKNERKPSSRRFRASSCIPRRISLRSIERSSTPLHHRVSTGRAPGGAQRAPGPFPGVRGGCAHAAPPRRARRRQSRQPQRLARERVGRRHGPLRRRRGRR